MRIIRFNGAFEFTGPITIQTVYGPGVSKHQPSLYGRGTTERDREDGNTTLGFHEHCHRCDFVEYLLTNPLPEVDIHPGMTVRQYEILQQNFADKFNAYVAAMADHSLQQTDEVGRKKSKYDAEHTGIK
jgi:hypothetical protein